MDLGLEELTPENREERLKRHCVKTTQALLHRSEPLKDVCFKCSDQEFAFAHKFILGTQCQCEADEPAVGGDCAYVLMSESLSTLLILVK
jgi:hypothetical protein